MVVVSATSVAWPFHDSLSQLAPLGPCASHFLGDRLLNSSPYAIRPLSVYLSVCHVCLSVTLVYCGQTVAGWTDQDATWYMEVGLSPGQTSSDGDPAHPQKGGGTVPPIFSPCLLWPNGWMDPDATWYGGMTLLRQHCARWGSSAPPPKKGGGGGTAASPLFGPCLLWSVKRLDVSRFHLVWRWASALC